MLCCVLAGVVVAAITQQLIRLPFIGAYFRRRQEELSRATEWRLFDD
jgi:hypothetical protein